MGIKSKLPPMLAIQQTPSWQSRMEQKELDFCAPNSCSSHVRLHPTKENNMKPWLLSPDEWEPCQSSYGRWMSAETKSYLISTWLPKLIPSWEFAQSGFPSWNQIFSKTS